MEDIQYSGGVDHLPLSLEVGYGLSLSIGDVPTWILTLFFTAMLIAYKLHLVRRESVRFL